MSMMPIWTLDRISSGQETPRSPLTPLPRTPAHQMKLESTTLHHDKENPWLDGPPPESEGQPNICSTLRRFEDGSRRMRQPGEEWPYRADPHNDSYVYYYDFRGVGDPPSDVGYVGDVYIADDFGVWICQGTHPNSEERRWTREWEKDMGLSFLIEHPLLKERYLWFRSGLSVGPYWYSRKGLMNVSISWAESYDYTPAIRTMFEAEKGTAPGKSSQKRRLELEFDDDDDDDDNDDTAHERIGKSITISKASISQKRTRLVDNSDDDDTAEYKDAYLSEQQATRKYIVRLENKIQTEKHNHATTRRNFENIKESGELSNQELRNENDELKGKIQQLRNEKGVADRSIDDLRRQVARLTAQNKNILTHARAMMGLDVAAGEASGSSSNDP